MNTRSDGSKKNKPLPHVYLPRQKLLYVSIPKSGCSTVKTFLYRQASLPLLPTHGRRELMVQSPEELKGQGIYAFTFIRHPVDRLVSCYRDKIRPTHFNNEWFTSGVSNSFRRLGIQPGLSFEAFVEFVSNTPDDRADNHFRSQAHMLAQFVVDFPDVRLRVFAIEGMTNQLEVIRQHFFPLNDVGNLEVLNEASEHTDVFPKPFLAENTRASVTARYWEDFELYRLVAAASRW